MISRARKSTTRVYLVLAVLGLVLLSAGASEAQRMQDRPNGEQADRAIDLLRSPYCPGVMLRVCTSPQAAVLRDSIYVLAAAGMNSDELVEWMTARYGPEYRALPPRSGSGLWAWVIPPAAILLAMGVILAWLRKQRTEGAPDGGAAVVPTTLSEADRDLLSAALRDWEDTGEEDV
jgi:cytochrome c-type biogenesis protein CcmH/NrfF